VAAELGISEGGLHNWVRQDRIDRGERPGRTTPESTELAKARKRIRQLETEAEILKRAAKLLGEDRPDPKGSTRWSENLPVPGSPRRSAAGCWA
jgi:transposase-like protein